MALSRNKKEELVASYTEMLQNSNAMIVTDYRGLDTAEMTTLRRRISEADGRYVVVKNRLFRIVMETAGYQIPDDFFDGPVAAGFCYGEVPPVAKALAEYSEDSDFLVLKGGLMDDDFLDLSTLEALASLPPLEVVRAQLLGLFSAPAGNVAGIVASGVRQVVNVISAYSEQTEDAQQTDYVNAAPENAQEEKS